MPQGPSRHMKRIKKRALRKQTASTNNSEDEEAPYNCKHCSKPYKSKHHFKAHESDPTKCPKHPNRPSKSPKRKRRRKVGAPKIIIDNWEIKVTDIDHKKMEKGDSHFVFEYDNGDHPATITEIKYHGRRNVETVTECIGYIKWEFDDKYHFGTDNNPLGTRTCKMLIDKNNAIFSPWYFNYEHAAQQLKDNNMTKSVKNSKLVDLSITDSNVKIHPKDGKHDQLLDNMVSEIIRCQKLPSVICDAGKTSKLSSYLVDIYRMRFTDAFFNKDKIQEIHSYVLTVQTEPKKQYKNDENVIKKDIEKKNSSEEKECDKSSKNSGKIPCRYCFKLLSKQGLKAHIANQHEAELKYDCDDPLCNAKIKSFSSKCDLQNHKKYYHGSRQDLEQRCPECEAFRNENNILQKRLINQVITNSDGSTRINSSWKNWKIPDSYKTFYDVVCSNKMCTFKRKYISDTHMYV
eukprot:179932_1